MLQINTGKLFANGVGRTNALRGVLYTNIKLPWQLDVVTAAGTLRATDGGRSNQAIVYELEERIEKSPDGPGALVSHTVSPFLQDFSTVASFALNAIMSPDPDLTRRLTNGQLGLASYHSPREFVRRCFDEQIWLQESVADEFVSFVNQLLALDRQTYLGAMRAIRTFVAGIHRITDDLGLAYTLMVSAIESLTQDFDGYSSTWQDIDERKRKPIDKALTRTSSRVSDDIRAAIISVEHVSLGRRYREYALAHIDESYFRTGDALLGRPIARYELEEALRQAYSLRSRYIHNLQALPDELTIPHAHWETTYVNRQPVLTFQGISRLTRHIIKTFVARGPTTEHQSYNYRREEAGIVTMRLAPECWIWQPLIKAEHTKERLEGFLDQLVQVICKTPDAKITDIRSVLADIERLLPRAAKKYRPAMVVLHVMFNSIVRSEDKTTGYAEFSESYQSEVAEPSGEALIARTYFGTTECWSIEAHQAAHDSYLKHRSKPTGLHAPRLIDAAISLELAERYRKEERNEEAKKLIAVAVENHPNHGPLVELEVNFKKDIVVDWREILLPAPAAGEKN